MMKKRLETRIRIEEALVDLASIYVAANYEQMDEIINRSLEKIGTVCRASRAYVFQIKDDGKLMDNTHEWVAPGVKPEIEFLKDLPCSHFPWWFAQLEKRDSIFVSSLSEMPPEAKNEREILEAQDITSVLIYSLKISGCLIGFIGLDNVDSICSWDQAEIDILYSASVLLSNTIERYRNVVRLKESEALYRTLVESGR